MDMGDSALLTARPLDREPMQRASGAGLLTCGLTDGMTAPVRLRQDGCAKIRLAPNRDGVLQGLLVNTAGGLTGGDRMAWTVGVGAGARAGLSTTSCERIYRSTGDPAQLHVTLDVGASASLDWLPQETILFDQARLSRRLEADVAADARLLIAESLLLGRRAMGETTVHGAFHDRWRVRRDGKLVFADDVRLDGALTGTADRAAALGGGGACAALLLVAPDAERLLTPLRAAIGDLGGASAFDGKLFCRLVAQDGFSLRQALLPALAVLSPTLGSHRVWSF